MVLYRPDCDCNDCELPNEKVTPSILAIEVWIMWLHVDGLLILLEPVALGWMVGWLTIGLKNRRRIILDDRQLYAHACK